MVDGERLKAARVAAGFKVADFAVAIGVKEPTVYRIENGQTPSVPTLQRWAEVCGVTMDDLVGREKQVATGTDG